MKDCIFIYNPISGKIKNKKRISKIISTLNGVYGEVDVIKTEYPKHATQLAKSSCGKYKYLIISGGDGTFGEIINGIAEEPNKPIIGYIPSGTVNDISNSLNIPHNYKKALKVIKNNNQFSHDIFKVNDNYGIYFCGTGAFTSTSYATKQKSKNFFGKLAYFSYCVRQIFKVKDFRLNLTDSQQNTISGKFIMMVIFNSKSVAGFKINKKAVLNDGKVDIVLMKRNHSILNYVSSILTLLKMFFMGIHSLKNKKHVIVTSLDQFDINISKSLIINIDGEKTFKGNFHFETIKEAIKIIIP